MSSAGRFTPGRLWSLRDIMHAIEGRRFALAFQSITSFSQMLISTMQPGMAWCSPRDGVDLLRREVDRLHTACLEMSLGGAVASLERIQEQMDLIVSVPGQQGLFGVEHHRMPAFKGA